MTLSDCNDLTPFDGNLTSHSQPFCRVAMFEALTAKCAIMGSTDPWDKSRVAELC